MDKKNDIRVNKISKREAAPKNIGTLVTYIDLAIGMACSLPPEIHDNLYDLMDKALDEYNELEAKYQEACGMISQYEEENRVLRDRRKKLIAENEELRSECESKEEALKKMIQEVTELEKEKIELEDRLVLVKHCNLQESIEKEHTISDLEADIKDLEVQVQVNTGIASAFESEIKQVIELAKSYGLIIYDDRKDAIPDDVKNIGMCGHYYVLGGRGKEESRYIQKLEKKWKNAENTIKELIQVLNYERIDVSHSKSSWTINNRALSEKTKHFDMQLHNLREVIRDLKADNVNLQKQADMRAEQRGRHIDLLDKLRWALEDKGIYCEWNEAALEWRLYGKNKLIDELKQHYEDELRIKREEIDDKNKLIEELTYENREFRLKNLINRTYGLTGQIELLNEEIDDKNKLIEDLNQRVKALESYNKVLKLRTNMIFGCYGYGLHSAQNELTEKIKTLAKENVDLKATLAMCERDANTAKTLCDNIAVNAKRARNKTPWFNDTLCNSRYLRKQGDDI